MEKLAFVTCIEAGVLERQALLLFQSIRNYAGEFSDCPIYAYSPRAGRDVSKETKRAMNNLDVEHVDEELNTSDLEYGTVNRIVAGAHLEANCRHESICIVDSDCIFVREPDAFRHIDETDMLARPVDVKGVCSAGPEDPLDEYWHEFCGLCNVSYDGVPYVTASIDRARVKASYNGGLVLVRSSVGVLQRTAEFFFAAARRDLAPRAIAAPFRTSTGVVSSEQARWWGSGQIALSLSAWSLTDRIRTLDPTYNYPLHLHSIAPDELRLDAWPTVKHIHYHWLLHVDPEPDSPLFKSDSPLTEDQQLWLKTNCEAQVF